MKNRILPVALMLCFLLASPASAEQTTAPATGPVELAAVDLTVEGIEAQIQKIQADTVIKESEKAEIFKLYEDALEQVRHAGRWAARSEELEGERRELPALLAGVKERLAAPVEGVVPIADPDATVAQLEQSTLRAEAELSAAQKRASDLEAERKQQIDRKTELPRLCAEISHRLDEIQSQLKSPVGPEGSPELNLAKRTLQRARQKALTHESEVYDREMLISDLRLELIGNQLDLASQRVIERDKTVKIWKELTAARRRIEAEQIAHEARKEVARAHPAVRQIAEENAAMAEKRSGADGLAARIEQAGQQFSVLSKSLADLKLRHENIRKSVDLVGLTQAVSLILRKERAELPDVSRLQRNINSRQADMSSVQFEIFNLDEKRAHLADINLHVNRILHSLDPTIDEVERRFIESDLREGLRTREERVRTLRNDYDRYFSELSKLNILEQQLITEAQSFAGYIDERILWFRSTTPLAGAHLAKTWEAVRWLIDPRGWIDVLRTFWTDLRTHTPQIAFAFLVFVILLYFKWRIRTKIRQGGKFIAGPDSFVTTIKILILSILMAVVWPFLIWFIAWRLGESPVATEFAKAVSSGLMIVAFIFLTIDVLMKLCLPGGLAESQFRWNPKNLKSIRAHIYWLMTVTLPLIFIVATIEYQNNEAWKDSLGRLAFIASLILFAVFLWRITEPIYGGLRRSSPVSREAGEPMSIYLWYLLILVPIVLVVITALGYYYTAIQMAWRMQATLWLLLALIVVKEMLLRWLYLAHRKLAIQKAQERQAAAEAQASEEPSDAGDLNAAPIKPESKEMTVFTISVQTRKLLQSLVAFSMIIGLWFIWADVLPALGILRQIVLWSTETAEINLANLILAFGIALMALIAGKNIPGLLEIAVLHRLPVDAGVRFAITTVFRYLITIIGFVIAFDTIGIGWNKIQWLIAAMTVGLGFGLQEIFANFISGLIILFERPIRVGDVVTVGEISGTVSRIQIRATTITEWDRKELIVPNKEFITGRVVNWTLSDRVLRLLIPVGVAYGTDTDLVQRLLLNVATNHPSVLKDPAPSAIFIDFGESSLNFELRAFIPNVDRILTLRHELNTEINKALREAGIQIPFPQQDIHVRSIKEYFEPEKKREKDKKLFS